MIIKNQADDGRIELFFTGDIGIDITGADFIQELSNHKKEKIQLSIFSGGGLLFDAFAIYDYILLNDIDIEVIVYGLSGSAATVVSCAGKQVLIGENSFYFIHSPLGSSEDVIKKAKEKLIDIYKKKTGLKKAEIQDLIKQGDVGAILTAKEALRLGFVDEIVSEPLNKKDKTLNHVIQNNMISVQYRKQLMNNMRGFPSLSDNAKKINSEEKIMTEKEILEMQIHNKNLKIELTNVKSVMTETETSVENLEANNKKLKAQIDKNETEKKAVKDKMINDYVDALIADGKIDASEKEDVVKYIADKIGDNEFSNDFEKDVLFKRILKPENKTKELKNETADKIQVSDTAGKFGLSAEDIKKYLTEKEFEDYKEAI